ncbi:MAG: SLC13 family permease, partial [Alteromonas sp.]
MDINQFIVLAIFASTIFALIFSNQRPSTVFSGAVLLLLVSQQLSLDDILLNLTNKGLITLVLLLLVSSAIDKTALIKRIGRKLVSTSFSKSYWKLFSL